MVSNVSFYDILIDLRKVQPTYNIYFVGQWDGHIMDWAGCNHRRIKHPTQPTFHSFSNAIAWAEKRIVQVKEKEKEGRYIEGEGTHVSGYRKPYNELVNTPKRWAGFMQGDWKAMRDFRRSRGKMQLPEKVRMKIEDVLPQTFFTFEEDEQD